MHLCVTVETLGQSYLLYACRFAGIGRGGGGMQSNFSIWHVAPNTSMGWHSPQLKGSWIQKSLAVDVFLFWSQARG